MAVISKDFIPDDGLIRLSIQNIKDIQEKGFSYFTFPNGQIKKITTDDLLFKKEEIEKLEQTKEFKNLAKEWSK